MTEDSRYCYNCNLFKTKDNFRILWCGKRSWTCRDCNKEFGDNFEDYPNVEENEDEIDIEGNKLKEKKNEQSCNLL